jgi:hypothetical protein
MQVAEFRHENPRLIVTGATEAFAFAPFDC